MNLWNSGFQPFMKAKCVRTAFIKTDGKFAADADLHTIYRNLIAWMDTVLDAQKKTHGAAPFVSLGLGWIT